MNSLLSTILRYDDNTLNDSILRLMSQYNRNQELYNQNTELMLGMIDALLQQRQQQTGNNRIINSGATANANTRTNANTEANANTGTNANTRTNANTNSRTYDDNEEQVYEFTLPTNISDMLLRALMPMDLSGGFIGGREQRAQPNYDATTTYCYQIPEAGEQLVCPISLEPIENNDVVTKINRCGHIFKHAHLQRWMQRDNRCPVCRGTI